MTSKTTTAGSDAGRQAVLDVLARVYQAWGAGDAEAFVADYTDDAWSGATAAGASPPTTTAPPARVSSSGYGAPPFRGAALHPDPNVPSPQQRWHGRDRQSKTVWTWSAERKEP
jgi:hypothetical protein